MCGLVGIAGDLEFKDELTMKRMLILDYFRGPDSTGFAAIRKNGEAHLAKIASNPVDLFDMQKFKSAMSANSSKAFIGHNRFATRGGVNTFNAHPFHYGNIVGAHNGTLEAKDRWALEEAVKEKFDVDSQAFFAAVSKLGIEGAMDLLHEGTSMSTGAWAFVWYDQDEDTLNFLRNKHRPLWYAVSEDFKKLFWASEYPMIDAALELGSGYKLHTSKKEGYKFWEFDENIHYKFDLGALKEGKSDPLTKAKAKELKGKELKAAASGGGDPFGREQTGFHKPTNHTKTTSTTNSPSSGMATRGSGASKKVLFYPMVGSEQAPYAGWLSKERYETIAKYGCSWCQKDTVPWGTAGVVIYHRDGKILCPSCLELDEEEGKVPVTRIYVTGTQIDAML